MSAPITLNLYDPETQEVIKPLNQTFIKWKLLKRSIRLNKTLGKKAVEDYEESDIDEITGLVIEIFGQGLTVEILDEQSDITEMIAVIRSIVSRARGIMDPTSPPKA